MPKYTRYQDYVIRDGRFVGEFEQMYRDFLDPWHETSHEQFASDKAAGLNLLSRLKERHGARRVVELGCGFGHFGARIAQLGFDVLGLDISETAIAKACSRHPNVSFHVGTIDDYHVLRSYRPDVVVMAEVTWYVLPRLKPFLEFLQTELPDAFLLHLLQTYPPGVQEYGTEYFTNLDGIKRYLGMHWLECGEVQIEGGNRTWALGSWRRQAADDWRSPIR